jgi:cold shock CspA family protein
MARQTGVVRQYSSERGFGYITPDSGGEKVYFQARNISRRNRYLDVGHKVEFELIEGSGKPHADDVFSIDGG